MKIEDLKPGMYTVTKQVVNPRFAQLKEGRDFHGRHAWAMGMRVCVTRSIGGEFHIYRPGEPVELAVKGGKVGGKNHPAFLRLVAALEPVAYTTAEFLKVYVGPNAGHTALERLIDAGKISRKDVKDIMGFRDSD
jgi:hypothetical protein